MSFRNKIKSEKKLLAHNHLVQGIIVAFIIAAIAFFMLDLDKYLTIQAGQFSDGFEVIFNNSFARFGVIVVFFYEFIPQTLMLLGITPIVVRILDAGVAPITLVFIFVIGKIIGQFTLWIAGRFTINIFGKNPKKFAGADHLMHKYRTLIFILPVFLGFVGDALLFLAGHQKIPFMKILPLLLLGDFIRIGIWIANVSLQSNIPGLFG